VSDDLQPRLIRAGLRRVDELEPIYRTLHERHAEVAPTLARHATRTSGESWARRRARYQRWLSSPGAFLILAENGGMLVGYALVSLGEGLQGWASGDRIGDLHDIAVLPSERNQGIGTALLDAVEGELANAGVSDLRLNVIAANRAALQLYERRGMTLTAHTLIGSIDPRAPGSGSG
jgi:ribosomal protein S18 acetylase RimI-like enzyme